MVKLNIGAGDTKIDGFIPIDRKFGSEACPLPRTVKWEGQTYDIKTNSVDEIRASHILEHFSFSAARVALQEWVRVLKPGGRLRVAVPDVDKVMSCADDNRLFYLMGGQTDENDFHKSAYDERRLTACLEEAGLVNIQRWSSSNTDCAALPISLNLEGVKAPAAPEQSAAPTLPLDTRDMTVRLRAFMTVPRYIAASSRVIIESALKPLGITIVQSEGVFYGQNMQRMFEAAIADDLDWILTVDSDSCFTTKQVSTLFDEFARHPEADAMAALQCRRGRPFPLLTIPEANQKKEIEVDRNVPIKVATAHFGLTLIRVSDLNDVPKPWFKCEPDGRGEWGDDRLDDDIWFWHQWRLAGKTIYVTPKSSIGHLEEMVVYFDDHLQPQHMYVPAWRDEFMERGHLLRPDKDNDDRVCEAVAGPAERTD